MGIKLNTSAILHFLVFDVKSQKANLIRSKHLIIVLLPIVLTIMRSRHVYFTFPRTPVKMRRKTLKISIFIKSSGYEKDRLCAA